jgi:uncharacterized protein YcbK (DUF882 family)
MKKFKLFGIICLLLFLVKIIFFFPANTVVKIKLEKIENEIQKRGYKTSWVIISEKRSKWYNSILSNSVDNSLHLQGDAIDLYVFDIDGDGKFNKKDILIFKSANKYVEQLYPELSGAVGTYTNKGMPTNHMIHIDVRHSKVSFNY